MVEAVPLWPPPVVGLSPRMGVDRAVNGAGDEGVGVDVVGIFCFRSTCIRTVPSSTTKAG